VAGPASRTVLVPPERLERWLTGFAERHGSPSYDASPTRVDLRAPDGSAASCRVPFPPLAVAADSPGRGLVAHALVERRVAVVLVRLGGFAVGIFEGPRLVASKVGSRHVQGRTAAGGWSQHRFARRREGQAKVAYAAAADTAARLLLPEVRRLDALVTGGDRKAVSAVLDDARLAPLRPLLTGPALDVGDPKRSVLDATPAAFRSVHITITDPPEPAAG